MCPTCRHTLGVLDLLPIVSWVALRGRCRYCRKAIGWHSPLLEISMATLFVLSYILWPFAFDARGIFLFILWLPAVVAMVALAIYDTRWMLLPNKIVFPLIGIAIVQVIGVILFYGGGLNYALQAVFSLVIAGGIFYGLYQLSKGKWIGGGDVKLGYALGLLLANVWLAALMLFTASILGILAALPGLISKKLKPSSQIPFGPFLIMATIIVMLVGRTVVDWYKTKLLITP